MPGAKISIASQSEVLFMGQSFPQEDEVQQSLVIISSPARRSDAAVQRAKYSGALLCESSFRCLGQLQTIDLDQRVQFHTYSVWVTDIIDSRANGSLGFLLNSG
jgi:hypothetical protein